MTTVEDADGKARRVLSDCRTTVVPALRQAVRTLPEPLWRVAGFHFGWLDEHGHPADGDAGKLIRPALALLSARAVGGRTADAIPAAVAVELVHNFSLLHDDIMDGDRTRRHRTTAWAQFGVPVTLLTGDALLIQALGVLRDAGSTFQSAELEMLVAGLTGMMSGQSADLDFPHRVKVSMAQCEAMAAGKTGAVMECACGLGAAFGGGSPEQVHHLREVGGHLGMAFQFADDLLGIWGDPAVTGKPAGTDLFHRKRSLPVVAALASATDAAAELKALYHLDRPLTPAELERATELVDVAGGRKWARERADHHLRQTRTLMRQAGADAVAEADLTALAHLLLHRDR